MANSEWQSCRFQNKLLGRTLPGNIIRHKCNATCKSYYKTRLHVVLGKTINFYFRLNSRHFCRLFYKFKTKTLMKTYKQVVRLKMHQEAIIQCLLREVKKHWHFYLVGTGTSQETKHLFQNCPTWLSRLTVPPLLTISNIP